MKVYVLQDAIEYQGEMFHGVYSTKERAEEAQRQLIESRERQAWNWDYTYNISEVEIDATPIGAHS